MTVLVTGGAGYIGSHAALALLEQGEEVLVVDNLSTGSKEQVQQLGAEFVEKDAGDYESMLHVIKYLGIKSVLHFAGSIKVEESVRQPLDYYRNNVEVTRNLLQAAVDGGVENFIFSSSAAVYGNPARVPVVEDMALAPQSPYGHTKLMAEQMLRDVARAHPLRFVALRYFNVAGVDPGKRTGYQLESQPPHLIRAAIAAALGRGKGFAVFGTDYPTPDGTCIRDFIHVSDLAEAHIQALQYLKAGGASTTLNCGYGRGVSVLEVVETVERVSGVNCDVSHGPRRPGDIVVSVADTRRIKMVLPAWKPRWQNIESMVRHQFEWEQSKHNLPVA